MKKAIELGVGVQPSTARSTTIWHDRWCHSKDIDIGWDLNSTPWRLRSNDRVDRFEHITAFDVMEHLLLPVEMWLQEAWLWLEPEGILDIRVPSWDNPLSYRDPTHHRVFHEQTFDFWDPSSELNKNYGRYYFPLAGHFKILVVSRTNADPAIGIGDLRFIMQRLDTINSGETS